MESTWHLTHNLESSCVRYECGASREVDEEESTRFWVAEEVESAGFIACSQGDLSGDRMKTLDQREAH